jgi:hypothetical protein
MKRLFTLAAAMLMPLAAAATEPKQTQASLVECSGNTTTTVSNRTGAQAPFRGVFKIEGATVTMVEGDTIRFSRSYLAHPELATPERPGYKSDNGNFFFYKDTGFFLISKLGISALGMNQEVTAGVCKPFVNSKVLD